MVLGENGAVWVVFDSIYTLCYHISEIERYLKIAVSIVSKHLLVP